MKTRILITVGDINGIGPEIILKTLNNPLIAKNYDITVVSPVSVLEYYYRLFGIKPPGGNFKIISVCEGKSLVRPGKISKQAGYIAGFAIQTAIELCMKKRYDAIVTAPISKRALNLGGFKFDGHTEMLTELSGAKDTAMIMVHNKLLVGFASTHPPLKDVPYILTKKMLIGKIKTCYDSLKKDFGKKNPKVGVLSLNPHAGEGGQIGNEEIETITPAVNTLKKRIKSLTLQGPFPSDSYFGNKTYTKFDLTFALYHDQGFIPFKMIAGMHGVNFTAGLSFVRTSPDHGTAFDIAGKNLANPVSLIEAIKTADRIVRARKKFVKLTQSNN
jgi:4-hydroxythreonine-4-phosphate dehydrogenase